MDLFKRLVYGTSRFVGKVALEALSTSAKLTSFTAKQLNGIQPKSRLPKRPRAVPHNATDISNHAYESMLRGVREANYKIITIPYQDFIAHGPGSAARSIAKGVPVGLLAPIAGASEALSYTLLGLRNQFDSESRREYASSRKGISD